MLTKKSNDLINLSNSNTQTESEFDLIKTIASILEEENK